MTARLADDASFAAELKARQSHAAIARVHSPARVEAASPKTAESGGHLVGESESTESNEGDGPPEWPDEEAEAAMLVELNGRETSAAPLTKRRVAREETDEAGDLPALDDALQKVPVAVRKTLDELFRAQFVQVRRVPAAVMKDRDAD